MEYFKHQTIPGYLTKKQIDKLRIDDAHNCLMYINQNIDEIRKIFQTQLEQQGHDIRPDVVEEVIYYLLQYRIENSQSTNNTFVTTDAAIAESLITIANIIDSINKGQDKDAAKELSSLPWGGSAREEMTAKNATIFAYWILSDEAKKQFSHLFDKHFKNIYNNDAEKIERIKNYET